MSKDKKATNVELDEFVNEAWVKYEAPLPLTAEELAAIAGIDSDVWILAEQKPNAWMMGRSDKTVDLEIVDGRMTGSVYDSGGWNKAYMYQMKARFVRRVPIEVHPVFQPIIFNTRRHGRKLVPKKDKGVTRILHITDPHFGFLVKPFEKPKTFHSRKFLSDLLLLCRHLHIDYLVWGGDILDLTDFSRWPTKPDIINNTQIAAIEAAWVINQFGLLVGKQKIIEGNHDIRMPNATAQNFSAAYELKPVYDLEGPALLSVPRILGFDTNGDIDWYPGYPDSMWSFGDVDFEHGGPPAPSQSGATVTKYLKEIVRTTIFGHIHRAERAEKHIKGVEGPIIAATPGCACRKETTPGAGLKRNWGIGAFYMTFVDGLLTNLEPIQHERGQTYFRGERYAGPDYTEFMEKDIPEKYMRAL
jgi:hypothetical protein